MLLCGCAGPCNDPRHRRGIDPIHGTNLQKEPEQKENLKEIILNQGERSRASFPRNYVSLPQYRHEWGAHLAYSRGAGWPLDLEWCGNVQATRLQPTEFGDEHHAQEWRQAEWRRQKARRRFSSKKVLEEYIGKRYSTNESAQANFHQKQFRRPSSEKRFYAFLKGMSAAFGTLE